MSPNDRSRDVQWGSFTERGPWELDPQRIRWLGSTQALRSQANA
ncbi:MAG: hypothetical protein RLZZ343_764, partial [Actinomycetota bacterium]